MRKLLIVFRMYDPSYSSNREYGNKKTLFVTLREDNVLSYSFIGGWQDSGMGFAISNLQLQRSLPLSPSRFKTTKSLVTEIMDILRTGVGSRSVASHEILNEIK